MIRVGLALFVVAFTGCTGAAPYSSDYQPPPISPWAVVEPIPVSEPVSAMGNKSPYTVFGRQYELMPSATGYVEEGVASWYGMKFQGRPTSNGETFDVYKATAAHKALPLPSYVRVTNLENKASMIVRVNDRGPFVDDRLIDVSYGVAVKLGFAQQGTARVRLEYMDMSRAENSLLSSDPSRYRHLQVGAYQTEASAQRMAEKVRTIVGATLPVHVSSMTSGNETVYRVRLGPADDVANLDAVQGTLRDNGLPSGQRLP